MPEVEVGRVSHYYSHISVAGLSLTDTLCVGDTIHIRGHSTDFTQQVESIEIEHQKVERAEAGAQVGVKVKERVRQQDVVYKVL